MRTLSFLFLSSFVALCAEVSSTPGADSPIRVEDAWARQAPMMPQAGHMHGGTGAVYVTLQNTGAASDALVGASSEAADVVELHETIREGEVMRMRPVAKLELPAGGVQEMKPGGYHIMLINLKRALRPGDRVPLTLTFTNAAPVSLDVPVR